MCVCVCVCVCVHTVHCMYYVYHMHMHIQTCIHSHGHSPPPPPPPPQDGKPSGDFQHLPNRTLDTSESPGGAMSQQQKYAPLLSAEGQSRLTVVLPGRHTCQCLAQKHALINNCKACGRIVCTQVRGRGHHHLCPLPEAEKWFG